jgi:hypothetical protein
LSRISVVASGTVSTDHGSLGTDIGTSQLTPLL